METPTFICIIAGPCHVGKTSFMRYMFKHSRRAGYEFAQHYENHSFVFNEPASNMTVCFDVWDYDDLVINPHANESCTRHAHCAIFMFDLTDPYRTIDYIPFMRDVIPRGIPIVYVGTHCDMEYDQILIANRANFPYFAISSLTGEGCNEPFARLARILSGIGAREWRSAGILHRDDGAAIEDVDAREYWLNGVYFKKVSQYIAANPKWSTVAQILARGARDIASPLSIVDAEIVARIARLSFE